MFVVPLFAAVGEFVLPGGSLIGWLRTKALEAVSVVPPLRDFIDLVVTFRLPSPLHDVATLIGALAIALVVLGALVHAALPVGPADAWPEGSSWRRAVTALDSLIALVARVLLIGAVVSFVPWLLGQGLRIPGPGPVVILLASAILVLVIATIGWPKAQVVKTIRAAIGASEGIAAAVLLALVAVAIAAVAYVAVAVEPLRVWMVGTAMAFLGFRILGAVGNWRWRVWDEQEREAFRALRPVPYPRGWPMIQQAVLAGTALFAGVVVVGGIEGLVSWVVAAVVALVLFSILRDAAIAAHPLGGPIPASRPVAPAQAAPSSERAPEPPAAAS
jgi:hypothetical protein